MIEEIKEKIEACFEHDVKTLESRTECFSFFSDFLSLLDRGEIRSAEKIEGQWQVNEWVKKGILLGFRLGVMEDMSDPPFRFFDKSTYPLKKFTLEDNIRAVPGGTSIRKGSYVASGVILMPPCYVNVGAYVDSETMLDSHSLVGSCAQVGQKCHVSAGAQIGGVLEPVNARPVIIEDNVLIGGNCGIYEGILIRENAILASGVILTSSTRVYDLMNETIIESTEGNPLAIPRDAVVVPGSRPASGSFAKEKGIHIYTPVIVKYRDAKSDAKTALEDALRMKQLQH